MRLLSYMLMVLGFCFLVHAGYQQYRGVTTAPGWLIQEQLAGIVKSGEIVRQKDPDDFRLVMALRCFFGIVSAFAGIAIYQYARKQDRLDPFSPNFEVKGKD